jgi:hypothetical protein
MISLTSLITTVHLLGLSLALGAATVKLSLLYRCRADHGFVSVYSKVARPITRIIILGMILLTLSGIGWFFAGYSLTSRLIIKIIIFAAIWILGPIIDNVIEPRFYKLAPGPGKTASPEFVSILNKYLLLDTIAGGLFYVIVIIWVLI